MVYLIRNRYKGGFFLKKAVAILLLILFIPITVLVTFYFSISSTLLNTKLVADKFNDSGIYKTITEQIVPQIGTLLVSGNSTQSQDQLSDQAINAMSENLNKNISAEWLKSQFEKTYQGIANYLDGKDSSKEIIIDLSPISNSLSIPNLSKDMLTDDFVKSQYESASVCSQNTTSNCISDSLTYEEFKTKLENELEKINSADKTQEPKSIIPEEINLYETFNIDDQTSSNFGQNMLDIIKNIVKNINYTGYILICILIAITIAIILMFSKNLYFTTKSLGTTFLITSIIIILLSLAGYFVGPIINILMPLEATGFAGIGLIITPLISSIVSVITTRIIIVGIILFILSVILLVYSKKTNPKNE